MRFNSPTIGPAIQHYQAALHLNPELGQAHHNLGIALQFEQALSCFQRALMIQPNDADALFNRGNALIELGRINEAIEAYEQTAALGSEQPILFSNLGNARRELGQLEASLAAFQTALTLDPAVPGAHWNLSLTLLLQGNYSEGRARLAMGNGRRADFLVPQCAPVSATSPGAMG